MTTRLPAGKLPARELDEMLSSLPQLDSRVLIGPQLGEDAAVLDFGERSLVVTTDPITFATDRIGWYAVNDNANDVAVMGAMPRWFFAVLLLPELDTSDATACEIMADVRAACDTLGVTVCGGHTEITTGLTRPIVIGQMLGDAPRAEIVAKGGLRPGDRILLTRGAAIEGTAILAREKAGALRARVPPAVLTRAEQFLFEPGISVVAAALAAVRTGGVRAMHDPTEGGIVTGLYELAAASGQGLLADAARIPIYPETQAVCQALGLDPLRLIASGALLLGAAADRAPAIIAALAGLGVPCVEIAEVRQADAGCFIREHGTVQRLEPAERDEIARAFGSS